MNTTILAFLFQIYESQKYYIIAQTMDIKTLSRTINENKYDLYIKSNKQGSKSATEYKL